MLKLSGMELFFILSSTLYLLTFCGYSITVYSLETELKASNARVETLSGSLKVLKHKQQDFKQKTFLDFAAAQKQRNSISNRTLVLESSLDSHETRWARIKLVRDAIKEHQRAGLTIAQMTDIAAAVIDMSDLNDVPVPLVLAMIKQESAFNVRAQSHAGALGVMQVMPETAKDIADEVGRKNYNLFNPKHSIQFGTFYLWKMLNRFNGDERLAVMSYNAGYVFIEKVNSGEWTRKFDCEWGQEDYYCETADYVKKVMEYRKEFEKLGL